MKLRRQGIRLTYWPCNLTKASFLSFKDLQISTSIKFITYMDYKEQPTTLNLVEVP